MEFSFAELEVPNIEEEVDEGEGGDDSEDEPEDDDDPAVPFPQLRYIYTRQDE